MSPNIKEPRSLIPIIREATEADAASLAALVQQLGRNDPFMVVSGFDPVTGVELLRSVIGATSDDGLFRIFVAECSGELAGPPYAAATRRRSVTGFSNWISVSMRNGAGSGSGRRLFNSHSTGRNRTRLNACSWPLFPPIRRRSPCMNETDSRSRAPCGAVSAV